MPDLFFDVTCHIRGKPDLDPHGFTLEYPEAGPDEFLEAEILRYFKRITGLMKHLDPVQGKDPDLVSHVAVVDVVIRVRKPDLFLLAGIKSDLEELLNRPVDIVTYRETMNQFLKKRIDGEAIYA